MSGLGRLVVVCGPTGTGKSDLAIGLAQRLEGEVVNADSMQLYRGMDIGTAKVPIEHRHGISHHLLDVLDVDEAASVAKYQQVARSAIEHLLASGRTPILVGGSGLYVQAVIDEITFPGTDPAVRQKYLQQIDQRGAPELHAELAVVDPAAAAAILPGDGRRIARALEVVEITGAPFTATMPQQGPARYDAVILTLDRSTEQLDLRLAQRVDQMLSQGFVKEVAELLEVGLRGGTTARKALGYSQLIEVIDGHRQLADAVADTVSATRRFVRRQRSWFRRDARRHDLDAGAPGLLDAAVALVRRAPPGPRSLAL